MADIRRSHRLVRLHFVLDEREVALVKYLARLEKRSVSSLVAMAVYEKCLRRGDWDHHYAELLRQATEERTLEGPIIGC